MSHKNILLITGSGMASVYNESLKIQSVFHDKGYPCDLVFFNKSSPQRTRVKTYDLGIWWTPFLPLFISPQKYWLNLQKCRLALSYYVIEGLVKGVEAWRSWLNWQYIVTPSTFVRSNLERMGVQVREVIPHQIWASMPVNHEYGRIWRDKFPRNKRILLYNGSQIERKALPKLRKAIDLLSTKRSDFLMVFHTDNVSIPHHTLVRDLHGVNTVVECEFPHIPIESAFAKMFYSDIIVHPAITEGFGLPVLEALNLGKTLVCINAYGVNEIANPKNSFMVMKVTETVLEWKSYIAFRVCDYNPQDLADQITLALESSREVLSEKQINGLETAKKFYNTYERFTRFL